MSKVIHTNEVEKTAQVIFGKRLATLEKGLKDLNKRVSNTNDKISDVEKHLESVDSQKLLKEKSGE